LLTSSSVGASASSKAVDRNNDAQVYFFLFFLSFAEAEACDRDLHPLLSKFGRRVASYVGVRRVKLNEMPSFKVVAVSCD